MESSNSAAASSEDKEEISKASIHFDMGRQLCCLCVLTSGLGKRFVEKHQDCHIIAYMSACP